MVPRARASECVNLVHLSQLVVVSNQTHRTQLVATLICLRALKARTESARLEFWRESARESGSERIDDENWKQYSSQECRNLIETESETEKYSF